MASYLKATHPDTRAHALDSPALYPPAALNISAIPPRFDGHRGVRVGGGEERKVVWDILDAVDAGVVTVTTVSATGWCDKVQLSIRCVRIVSGGRSRCLRWLRT